MRKLGGYLSQLATPALVVMTLLAAPQAQSEKNYRSPEGVEGAVTSTADQAKALYDQGVAFIDVRNPRLYARKHIPGAHHLDFKDVFTEQALMAVVDRDDPLLIYCSGVKCSRSSRAAAMAVSWGFTRVHYFRGGIVEWKNAGYPVETSDQ